MIHDVGLRVHTVWRGGDPAKLKRPTKLREGLGLIHENPLEGGGAIQMADFEVKEGAPMPKSLP